MLKKKLESCFNIEVIIKEKFTISQAFTSTDWTTCSNISIVDFELINSSWINFSFAMKDSMIQYWVIYLIRTDKDFEQAKPEWQKLADIIWKNIHFWNSIWKYIGAYENEFKTKSCGEPYLIIKCDWTVTGTFWATSRVLFIYFPFCWLKRIARIL